MLYSEGMEERTGCLSLSLAMVVTGVVAAAISLVLMYLVLVES